MGVANEGRRRAPWVAFGLIAELTSITVYEARPAPRQEIVLARLLDLAAAELDG